MRAEGEECTPFGGVPSAAAKFVIVLALAGSDAAHSYPNGNAPGSAYTEGVDEAPLRFMPDPALVGTNDTQWVNWAVTAAMPLENKIGSDANRQHFLDVFEPDVID